MSIEKFLRRDRYVNLFGLQVEDEGGKIKKKMKEVIREIHDKRELIVDRIFEINGCNSFTVVPKILRKRLLLRRLVDTIIVVIEKAYTSLDRLDVEDLLEKDFDISSRFKDFMSRLDDRKDAYLNAVRSFNLFGSDDDEVDVDYSPDEILDALEEIIGGFIKYNSCFFKGEFLDRNGVSKEFKRDSLEALADDGKELFNNIKSGNGISVEIDDATGKLASQVIAVALEFIFDSVFEVPFYCREIAEAKRNMNPAESKLAKIIENMNSFEDNPNLDPRLSSEQQERQKSLVLAKHDEKFQKQEIIVNRLKELDSCPLGPDQENVAKSMAKAYTCYAAGVIEQPIRQIFLDGNNNPDHDYAVLVGELTAQLSVKAASSVKSAVGAAVKGLWEFSINNEALTEIMASAAAIIAKKVSEKFIYEIARIIITDSDLLQAEFHVFGNQYNKKYLMDFLHKSFC